MKDEPSKDLYNQMDEIANDMERLFYHLFCPKDPAKSLATKKWHPLTDVIETESKLVIKLELAGVDKKDISILLREHCLVITGRRREIVPPKIKSYHQMEVNYGEFERTVHLTPGTAKSAIEAKFGNGFLTIIVDTKRRRPSTKKVHVEIK